jgi:methionyl-tRNA formyltransferase
MIHVYTKERHVTKIDNFLNSIQLEHRIFTSTPGSESENFDLGVSYCFPKRISEPLLGMAKKGFVNYHPGPLPKYKGPFEYEQAIKNKETHWGVTVHQMDKNFDSGEIIEIKNFDLHDVPSSIQELGAISHHFLFNLFKETIQKIYNN